MAPTSSVEANPYSTSDQARLLQIARDSIDSSITSELPLKIIAAEESAALQSDAASFVTLKIDGDLRGCIGSLDATRALAVDVAENAFSAARHDPRFPPVTAAELPRLAISLSILSTPEKMQFSDQEDLLRQLQPGRDGLVLRAAGKRGTFLPAVWESLPEPREFLDQLKVKAGLPEDYWSSSVEIERYRAHTIA